MSFKILRVKQCPFNTVFNSINNQVKSFSELYEKYENKGHVYSDSFSLNMNTLGNYTNEIISNWEFAQKIWAKEKGIKYFEKNWENEILFNQILYFKPEVIFFQNNVSLSDEYMNRLKNDFKFLKKIIVHNGFPVNPISLKNVDLVLCTSKSILDFYKNIGIKTELLYHYFDKEIERKLNLHNIDENEYSNLTFLGSSGLGKKREHITRYKYLDNLLNTTDIKCFLHENYDEIYFKTILNRLKKLPKQILRNFIILFFKKFKIKKISLTQNPKLNSIITDINNNNYAKNYSIKPFLNYFLEPKIKLKNRYPNKVFDAKYGLDYYEEIKKSLISFNIHTDQDTSASNLRMFHVAGLGSCLLTDYKNNILDLFQDEKEIITYKSLPECKEKIKFLLNNKKSLDEIRLAGKRRVYQDHTTEERCKELNIILKNLI